jgi:hypothetical protein
VKLSALKPSGTILVAVLALVVGLEAPAMAHQVNVIAHKLNGSTIAKGSIPGDRLKNNEVTGKQVNEKTLSTVPSASNATKLAGKPASAYATAAAATASGLVSIPTGGGTHVLFTHYPLTWEGTCTVTGADAAFTLTVKAAENVMFTQGPASGDLGTAIDAGKTFEVDDGSVDGTIQTVTFYTVTGQDHAASSGLFTGGIHLQGDPCATSVTASG